MTAEGKALPGLQVPSSVAPPAGHAGQEGSLRREGLPGLAAATRCLCAQNLGDCCRQRSHLVPRAMPLSQSSPPTQASAPTDTRSSTALAGE